MNDVLWLQILKTRAQCFDAFTSHKDASRLRRSTNVYKEENGLPMIDHFEWRSKLQKAIRLLEKGR